MFINLETLFTLGFIALFLAAMWRERGRRDAAWDAKEEAFAKIDRAVKDQYLTAEEAARVLRVIRGY